MDWSNINENDPNVVVVRARWLFDLSHETMVNCLSERFHSLRHWLQGRVRATTAPRSWVQPAYAWLTVDEAARAAAEHYREQYEGRHHHEILWHSNPYYGGEVFGTEAGMVVMFADPKEAEKFRSFAHIIMGPESQWVLYSLDDRSGREPREFNKVIEDKSENQQ